jgi:hypothetical protein
MKMNQAAIEIDRNDTLERVGYSIKATGLSFQILSSGLYKDKIKAIIRELSCNAWDAHVAAGTDQKPFDVHLPTMLEPHFSIRDYGTGLSKENCQKILPRFFESTKTDSNDFIGAMGLGSKSPFCYVDSYTITSNFNGMKYIFNSLIGEDGQPGLELMDEQETTEPNGLEISLPSKQNDINVWKDRAELVYQWFDVKPNMTGAPININPTKYLFEGTSWKLRHLPNNHSRYGYHQSSETAAIALMGKIAYPLSYDALKGHLDDLQLSLLKFPLEIRFDIGELEFAASREELSYKPDTVAAIKKRIALVLKEVPAQSQEKFDKATSLWEAKHLVFELFQSQNSLSQIVTHIVRHKNYAFKYAGNDINTCDISIEFKKFPGLTYKHVGVSEMGRLISMDDLVKRQNEYLTLHKIKYDKLPDHAKVHQMAHTPNVLFFVNDLNIGPGKRLTKFAEHALRYRHHGGVGNVQAIYLIDGPQNIVDAFIKELGDPPVHKTSELPVPEKSQPKKKHQYRLWQNGHGYWNDIHSELPDQQEVVYYAYVARDMAAGGNYSWDVTSFRKLMSALYGIDTFDKNIKIVGLNKIEFDKQEARTDTKWVRIDKMADQLFAKILANTKLVEKLVRLKSIEFIHRDWSLNNMITSLSARVDKLDATKPMHQYLTKFKECNYNDKDLRAKMATFFEFVDVMNKNKEVNTLANMSTEWNVTLNSYPILKYINMHYMDNFNDIISYIILVDNVAK